MKYLPILKSKQGELGALTLLESKPEHFSPIIEILGATVGLVERDDPKKDPLDRTTRLAGQIVRASKHLDIVRIDYTTHTTGPDDGELERLRGILAGRGLTVKQVLSTDSRLPANFDAIQNKFQIRIPVMTTDVSNNAVKARLVRAVKMAEPGLDIIVDLGQVESTTMSVALTQARAVMDVLVDPKAIKEFGFSPKFVVTAGAHPKTMTQFGVGMSVIPRIDMTGLARFAGQHAEVVGVGDYGVQHCDPPPEIKGAPNIPINLRYATRRSWLFLKGERANDAPDDGMKNLCQELVGHELFEDDETFSAEWINEMAAGPGTGNSSASMWRKVGTHRHLVKTIAMTATRRGP